MEEGMQPIDGNGRFNVEGLKDFLTTSGFARCGLSYAIVAIIGAQSSGKSTLMNHVFRTNFEALDAYKGRGRTTKGIWMAKANDIEPFTIAMDLEGTDSNERGEDNTAFEKQSALFALAITDIVLINLWCKDIGLEHAASRPLLKTVFQVMKRLFKPRKKTLLFVIRDHTKTPLEYLKTAFSKDIEKIWAAVSEPETHRSASLSDFFNVDVIALSSYEFEEDKLKEQAAISEFSDAVVNFDLPNLTLDAKFHHLREHARAVVKKNARYMAHAERVLQLMKDRFKGSFTHEQNSKSWYKSVFGLKEIIDEMERKALSASLKILSIMAAICLDNEPDQIEYVLLSSLMDKTVLPSSQDTGTEVTLNLLALRTWEEVSPNVTTLLKPEDCLSLWMKLKEEEVEPTVAQARSQFNKDYFYWTSGRGGNHNGAYCSCYGNFDEGIEALTKATGPRICC